MHEQKMEYIIFLCAIYISKTFFQLGLGFMHLVDAKKKQLF